MGKKKGPKDRKARAKARAKTKAKAEATSNAVPSHRGLAKHGGPRPRNEFGSLGRKHRTRGMAQQKVGKEPAKEEDMEAGEKES